jgi:hypothetical protein
MTNKPIPQFMLPDDLEAQYVNFARISHTASEFILDFSLLLPDGGQPKIDTRVVMSPMAVKLFLRALTENVARYESKFGEITLPLKHTLADELFRPNTNPDDEKE